MYARYVEGSVRFPVLSVIWHLLTGRKEEALLILGYSLEMDVYLDDAEDEKYLSSVTFISPGFDGQVSRYIQENLDLTDKG